MSGRKYFELRYAVGSATGPRSAVMRVWARDPSSGRSPKSDIYIAYRSLAEIIKISLHESGDWRFSFTHQHAESCLGTLDARIISRWSKPTPVMPGIRCAFKFIVPESELRIMSPSIETEGEIEWLSAPLPGFALESYLYLGAPGSRPLGPSTPGKTTMRLLAEHTLSNGETLWVVFAQQAITKASAKLLADAKENALKRSGMTTTGTHPRGYLFLENLQDGARGFLDIALS